MTTFCMNEQRLLTVAMSFMLLLGAPSPGGAQLANSLQIDWEVTNRFRLFATQEEFDRHLKAMSAAADKTVLGVEKELELESNGRGWAATVGRLCYDSFRGRILETCKRDGRDEVYLNAKSARIKLTARLPAGFGDATCHWVVGTGNSKEERTKNCRESIDDVHAGTQKPTPVEVTAQNQAGANLQAKADVQVRDVFIVGLGDSIASGEGNPTSPIALDDEGFCFRRALSDSSRQYVRPGRANVAVNKSCQPADADVNDRETWSRANAGWLFSSCHRSLYGYQTRAALALAIENPQIIVTYLPLGCTGATIREGMLNSKEARERARRGTKLSPPYVEEQIGELRNYLRSITANGQHRPIDLVFLTVGANDIGFSGLVANVVVKENPERRAIKSTIVDPDKARGYLKGTLGSDFRALRAALRGVAGGKLDHVVFTSYGNPGTYDGGKTCPATREGFDIHPAFSVDGDKLAETVQFVNTEFFPILKSYVKCTDNGCSRPDVNAMTFVDGHQAAFGDHGFCASSDKDPSFDKDCFRDGDSFRGIDQNGLTTPLRCTNHVASNFKAYADRARWVRTANDSFFSAMTYPDSNSFFGNPSDIHDARWGLESVVYGGALHPTAEGHAAMADAALVAARKILGLPAPNSVSAGR